MFQLNGTRLTLTQGDTGMEEEAPAESLTPEERFSELEEENSLLKGAIEALLAGVNA